MIKLLIPILSMILITQSIIAQSIVQIHLKEIPPYHPAGSDVFAAGSFNGWNPADVNYKFQKKENGELLLDLKLNNGTHEFKLTRGSWDKVECKKDGSDIQNRVIRVDRNTDISISVEEWKDRFPVKPKKSTAGKNVHIIDTAFLIPQLNRIRRVWVYLPDSYTNGKQKYPVLYMHDGQNIFDEATAFAGEWGVDETLDTLGPETKECIVVAVDHGGAKRLNEYNPYNTDRFGKGEGDLYLDFLVKTLKPYIDKKYRTRKKKDDTFIAGSSMGGLISLYAVLKYPKVFGGAGVFSPAFWIGNGIFNDIRMKGKQAKSHIYFYGGKQENETMIPDMLKAFEEMRKVSKSKMEVVIRDDGKHNEPTWRKEFPLFYSWIMRK
jgi:predicted alpha/beta superfamily hydrolase